MPYNVHIWLLPLCVEMGSHLSSFLKGQEQQNNLTSDFKRTPIKKQVRRADTWTDKKGAPDRGPLCLLPGRDITPRPPKAASLEGDSSPSNAHCVRCYPQRRGGDFSPAPLRFESRPRKYMKERPPGRGSFFAWLPHLDELRNHFLYESTLEINPHFQAVESISTSKETIFAIGPTF